MKKSRLSLVVMAVAAITFGVTGSAMAFHGGGVGHCDGCHTMHNSMDGAIVANGGSVGTGVSTWLTKGSDPSSTCLNCHDGAGRYHIASDDGSSMTPGGDFYWMTKSFSWSAHGSTHTSRADDHGHNIIAADFGFTQDATLTTAPGGTYPAAFLGCNSCHDPHGKKNGGTQAGFIIEGSGSYGATGNVGNFRLLGDTGYDGGEDAGANFGNPSPVATAPGWSGINETDNSHTDYGQGMSEWCANCHTGFTADSSNPMRHPSSNDAHLGTNLATNYNSYVQTGNFGGAQATSYLALVPFERGTNDPTALIPSTTVGPDATSNVMCLSCHRSHASAFENMTRWDMTEEFIADSHPTGTGDGSNGSDLLYSYYGRDIAGGEMGAYQRQLCNKCHVQD